MDHEPVLDAVSSEERNFRDQYTASKWDYRRNAVSPFVTWRVGGPTSIPRAWIAECAGPTVDAKNAASGELIRRDQRTGGSAGARKKAEGRRGIGRGPGEKVEGYGSRLLANRCEAVRHLTVG
ncbi:hypothetical protein KM043_011114 [Ampulex compressa]|nr:hypothetical protein KM043_011114 [Ampulex compressa]